MADFIGRQLEVGVGVEATRGTAETTASQWLKKISMTVVPRATKTNDESTRNVLADSLGTRLTQLWVEGDLNGNIHADPIGFFFYNIYGVESVSTVEAGVYSHEFSEVTSVTKPSLTLFGKEAGVNQAVFSNCMVGSFEISAAPDQYVSFNSSFTGIESASNADTPSYNTEYDFVGRDVTLKVATTEAGLVGATALPLKDVTISWDLGLIPDFVLGQYTPQDVFNSQTAIEGSFTINYTASTWETLFRTDAYRYFLIEITGTQTIGLVSNPKISILLNKVAITDRTREDSAGDLVTESVTFKAYYNDTDSQQSETTVVNVTPNYDLSLS
jgi:hypothetical protein